MWPCLSYLRRARRCLRQLGGSRHSRHARRDRDIRFMVCSRRLAGHLCRNGETLLAFRYRFVNSLASIVVLGSAARSASASTDKGSHAPRNKQGRSTMTMRPDPTFHASPKLAMEAPPENFAYTLLLSPDFSKPDALAVIDAKPGSRTFSQIVHTVTMPYKGDEFHHFGWNACSSALSPLTGHAFVERRYVIIPGLRVSILWIRSPMPPRQKFIRSSSPRRCSKRPVTRGPTRSIVVRKASTSARSEAAVRRAPMAHLACSSWTARRLTSSAAGRSIVGPKTCTTISGGTCRATTW